MEWYKTATKAELKKVVAEAVGILKYGPCSTTTEQCAGCSADWYAAAGLLMFGPDIKKPLEATEAVTTEEPEACC